MLAQLRAQRAQRVRVQPRGGLVEQQDLGLAEQRRGEREPPPGPVRARADPAVGHGLQAGALERLVGIAAPGACGRQRELVVRGAAGMEAVAVEHAADPPGRVRAAGRRPGEAEQDPQRRRLAGAVRAEEAAHAALRDREREPVERRRAAVALGQVLDGERVHPFEDAAERYLHAVYLSVIETVTVNDPFGSFLKRTVSLRLRTHFEAAGSDVKSAIAFGPAILFARRTRSQVRQLGL